MGKGRDAGPGGTRMVVSSKAMDRAYPRYDERRPLEENVAAAAISFTAAELKELDTSLTALTIQGDRLPPAVLAATGVEAPPKR
jgi:hypothetical protein